VVAVLHGRVRCGGGGCHVVFGWCWSRGTGRDARLSLYMVELEVTVPGGRGGAVWLT